MGRPRKEALRERKEEEQREGKQVTNATSERGDTVTRTNALHVVAGGTTGASAGRACFTREAVAHLVDVERQPDREKDQTVT
jgi:hypothetical protein